MVWIVRKMLASFSLSWGSFLERHERVVEQIEVLVAFDQEFPNEIIRTRHEPPTSSSGTRKHACPAPEGKRVPQ